MGSIIRALPDDIRRRLQIEYREYLLERDGVPDLVHRQLPARENFFLDFESGRSHLVDTALVSQEEFSRWHEGRAQGPASPLVDWLVGLARANEGEAWGVELFIAKAVRNADPADLEHDLRLIADLEELYHTRLLRDVVRLFGLDFSLRSPPRSIQSFIRLIAHSPKWFSNIALLAGEIIGTVAFARMMEEGDRLLADVPALQDGARLLLDEILIDEIGHVGYLLSTLNRAQVVVLGRMVDVAMKSVAPRNAAAPFRDAVRNYSLDLFPDRVIGRAFAPPELWQVDSAVA